MTIAAAFSAALAAVTGPDTAGPELLPVRLASAAAAMLGVDGAGLSMTDREGRPIPLGASSPAAGLAERLQFGVGSGPCTAARHEREPVFATLADLRRRWPPYARVLTDRTPYRGIVALPLSEGLVGTGVLDLYVVDDRAVARLDVFAATAVGELITTALSEATVFTSWPADRGPAWLHSPAAQRRAEVWEAAGKLSLVRGIDFAQAVQMLQALARAGGRDVDHLAADLLAGRVRPEQLRLPRSSDPA